MRRSTWVRTLGCAALAAIAAPAVRAQDSLYVGHPRLLFTSADIAGLQSKVHNGGDDDAAYAGIVSWAAASLALPPSSLLGSWEGTHSIAQFCLAAALEPSGETYAAKAREMALYLARNRGPTNDEFASALRLQGMAYAYDMAFTGGTAAERDEIRDEMRAYLDYMPPRFNYYCQAYNPYAGNHGMTAGAAIGLAVIALWDETAPTGRDSLKNALEFGDLLVAKCMTDILAEDGAYREGVLYGAWILRMAAPYFEARRRFDGKDFAADPRFERMLTWLCYELDPRGLGRTNNLNDSPWSTRPLALHNTLLEWGQTRFNSSLARYLHVHVAGTLGYDFGAYADRVATVLWSQPLPLVNPQAVLPTSRLFPARGLYYARSGWQTGAVGEEMVFSFFSGTFYGGHAQEDQNQITLSSHGERWVVDCGGVGSSQTPKESAAHNIVLVDGRGQHNAGNSIGTDGRIAAALLSRFADYVRGDARDAYATYSPYNAPGTPFPTSDWSWGYDGGNPLERADRLCLVVKDGPTPGYVLVADDMRKDAAPHDWDWNLHTSTAHIVDLLSDPARLQAPQSTLDVYFAHPRPADLALSVSFFNHGGVDPATNRIVARVTAVEPRFCVALVPRGAAQPPPAYSAASDSVSTTVTLDWGSRRDVAVFGPGGASVGSGVTTDGRFALVRRGPKVENWLLGEGTSLGADGLDLVSLGGPGSAVCAGDTLHLSRADVSFVAYAPQVLVVAGPTGRVPHQRDGDFVRSLDPSDVLASEPALRISSIGPNPARGRAIVSFQLGAAATVHVRVLDARGRIVAELASRPCAAGAHWLPWDGRDRMGRVAAPGTYVVEVRAGSVQRSAKLVWLP